MNTRKFISYGLIAVMIALPFTACLELLEPTLTGIKASYSDTATIYTTTPLDTLKANLTVTAQYEDNTSKTLNASDYTLSGILTIGSSSVTVSYEGKTTFFTVTVTAASSGGITYNIEQIGGADGTANSTGIEFTFSADPGNLTASEINVSGNVNKGNATVAGSGTTRTLSPISVITAGEATVSITKTGIETAAKSIIVYKEGQMAPEYWSINWNLNGGTAGTVAYYPTLIEKGKLLAKPSPNPSKAGYTFGGWHTNSALTQMYNFNSPVTANLTLYAKWETVAPPTSVQGTTLAEKLQWITSNAASNSNYIIEVSSDEFLNSHTLSYDGKSNITIQLTGIGSVKTIDLYGSGSLFTVENGVTLILNENIILKGNDNTYGSLVRIDGGNLVLNNGSKITGNNSYSSDGVVFVSSGYNYNIGGYEGGTFTMNGGEISGNAGRGVYVSGEYNYNTGGYEGGTFTMNGGEISGNTGGGVYVSNGTFTMTGGEISGNTSSSSYGGGGVYINSGTFIMSGGEISGNTVNSSYSSYGGGGVYVSNGTFTMTGGEISGNTVNSSSSSYGGEVYGGGVYVNNYSSFEKTGGIITGYADDSINGNVVKEQNGNVLINRGHAVYVEHNDSRFIRRKEITAGQQDNLSYIRNEPAPPTINGAWDE